MIREKRKASKSYFYIDYHHVINMIKYKIYKIRKSIEKEEQAQMTQLPYRCPYCDKQYSALDALTLQRTPEMLFLCEECNVPLEPDENDTNATNERYVK